MPPEGGNHVFEKFYRAPNAPAGGIGLGLSIVKSIADLHGATVAVERSASLGGLRVVVSFPISVAGQAKA